jgi:preprotein translocase subunit Sec61beta
LSKDTDDSDSYDVESGGEDSEDRPWRPSHAVFGKSTIKHSHLDNMRGRYFRDMSIVRAGADRAVPAPKENEVVIFRSFFKAGLRFPLSKFVVEVLKTYQIFLHQITPEAIIRMGIFVWAVRSQGLEPSARCFCSMHELSYETKPWVKNNIITISVAIALLLALAQATQCQRFGRDGLGPGWKSGFT